MLGDSGAYAGSLEIKKKLMRFGVSFDQIVS